MIVHRCLIGLLLALSLAYGQANSRNAAAPPKWITAKWAVNDSQLKAIRLQLDQLWKARPLDDSAVLELYRRNVLPNKQALRAAPFSKQLDPGVFYWLIALEAYFGDGNYLKRLNLQVDTGFLLDTVAAPASYEFARVAFAVYVDDGNYVMPDFSFADRLLSRWDADPIVRKATVQLGLRISGSKTARARAQKIAEELYSEYPKHADTFLPLLSNATYMSWKSTKDPEYLRKTVQHLDAQLARKEPYFVRMKEGIMLRKKLCELDAKQAGIKLD